MIRIFGTGLAALLGLAFGSFLNVCLSRWPEGESVVKPRSHCRNCGRTLSWWENIPLLSWIALRGRCRRCQAKISWRYPLVELTIGVLWALIVWRQMSKVGAAVSPDAVSFSPLFVLQFFATIASNMILIWLLVALAALDAEHLWLPNWITLPGIGVGLLLNGFDFLLADRTAEGLHISSLGTLTNGWLGSALASLISAALILLIRWIYWLIRHREGIGLGDAKLMAMLGAWLGLSGSLVSFAIGVLLGAVFALIVLAIPAGRRGSHTWLASRLPFGTFLCIGGIISAFWGNAIASAYLHWIGL